MGDSQSIYFNYQKALSQCRTMEDITGKDGLVQKIIRDAVEHIPGQEPEDYISEKNNSGDKVSRNGSAKKNIKTAYGNIGIHVPRTREPGFEPEVIKKGPSSMKGWNHRSCPCMRKG